MIADSCPFSVASQVPLLRSHRRMLPLAWPLATEEEEEEGEEAMEVTEGEWEEPTEGERDVELMPFLMSQTATESRAPTRRYLPEGS